MLLEEGVYYDQCVLLVKLLAFAMLYFVLQDKPFNITVIQIYAPTINAKEAEVEWFY